MKETAEKVSAKIKELLPLPKGKGKSLFEAMDYSASRGKRLRPYLLIETAKMFGVDEEYALRTACALELIHCFSLVHDDLPAIDNDDLRRGKPTTHKKYDEATAILAGDGLLTYAFQILADEKTHPDANIRTKLVTELSKSTLGMIEGEYIDILADKGEKFNLEETTLMQELKTGCLIAYATTAGAILGGANKEQTDALYKYAINIGLAFQIADDILDVEGDEEKVGKALKKDDNKATFVSLLGLENAKIKAKELIEDALKQLLVFDSKGAKLGELAKFIIERDR